MAEQVDFFYNLKENKKCNFGYILSSSKDITPSTQKIRFISKIDKLKSNTLNSKKNVLILWSEFIKTYLFEIPTIHTMAYLPSTQYVYEYDNEQLNKLVELDEIFIINKLNIGKNLQKQLNINNININRINNIIDILFLLLHNDIQSYLDYIDQANKLCSITINVVINLKNRNDSTINRSMLIDTFLKGGWRTYDKNFYIKDIIEPKIKENKIIYYLMQLINCAGNNENDAGDITTIFKTVILCNACVLSGSPRTPESLLRIKTHDLDESTYISRYSKWEFGGKSIDKTKFYDTEFELMDQKVNDKIAEIWLELYIEQVVHDTVNDRSSLVIFYKYPWLTNFVEKIVLMDFSAPINKENFEIYNALMIELIQVKRFYKCNGDIKYALNILGILTGYGCSYKINREDCSIILNYYDMDMKIRNIVRALKYNKYGAALAIQRKIHVKPDYSGGDISKNYRAMMQYLERNEEKISKLIKLKSYYAEPNSLFYDQEGKYTKIDIITTQILCNISYNMTLVKLLKFYNTEGNFYVIAD